MKKNILLALVFLLIFFYSGLSANASDNGGKISLVSIGKSYSSVEDFDFTDSELFEGFVEKSFRSPSISLFSVKAGDYLTGLDKTVYDLLKTEIIKVAKGERSDTVFRFTNDQLGLSQTWSAADLGFSMINQQNYNDAASAALNKWGIDGSSIIDALMVDMPYELFWFDKTVSYSYGSYPQGSISLQYNSSSLTIGISGIEISMNVIPAYSSTNAIGSTTTNSTKIISIQTAAQNVKSTVAKYSSYDDYDKLLAYKDYICNQVSYDHDAVDNKIHYADQWQLIYVFDEDSSTNVVCEGYSKAFQYLCDLSSFEDDVYSIIVSGTMAGATGSGGHMWNVVHMDDGKNYMVDVTNCDTGSIGNPDKLFLAGYGIEDSNYDYKYSLGGQTIVYVYDNDTKNSFSVADITISNANYVKTTPTKSNPSISDLEYSLAGNFTYNARSHSILVSVKSTITGMGNITVKYVVKDGDISQATSVGPVNAGKYDVYADISSGSSYKAAILKLGTIEISRALPSYSVPNNLEATCSLVKNCEVSLPSGFSYDNPNGTLTVGNNQVSLTFIPSDTVNYKTVSGIQATIVKADHSFANKTLKSQYERKVNSTCTEEGYFLYKYLCDNGCNTESTDTYPVINTNDPAKGHTYGNWNVVTHKTQCVRCDNTKEDNNAPTLLTNSIDDNKDIHRDCVTITVEASDDNSGISSYYLFCSKDLLEVSAIDKVTIINYPVEPLESKIMLNKLEARTTYYYLIGVGDFAGNIIISDVSSFTTLADTTKDFITISFDGNGSTSGAMESESYQYNSDDKLSANAFYRTGYSFAGWNTKADGSGKAFVDKETVSAMSIAKGDSIILYAQWKVVVYNITYILDGGSNSSDNPTSYTIETETIELKSPNKDKFNFIGWYRNSEKVTHINKGSTGEITLTAKWQEIEEPEPEDPPAPVIPTGFEIAKLYLNKGAKVSSKFNNPDKLKVTYTSSNKSVVAVDSKGKLTAKKIGKATITAKVNGKNYKCQVSVYDPKLEGPSTVSKGKSVSLKIKNGYGKTTWKSSNKKIATISSKGKVTGKKKGTVTITAVNNGKTLKKKISVQ